jgi:hypothetical protein
MGRALVAHVVDGSRSANKPDTLHARAHVLIFISFDWAITVDARMRSRGFGVGFETLVCAFQCFLFHPPPLNTNLGLPWNPDHDCFSPGYGGF